MSRFITVALDSWKKQLKSPSFWLVVFMPIIMMAISGVITYFTADNSVKDTYIVAEDEIGAYFKESHAYKLKSKDEAIKAMEDKEIGSFVEIKEEDGSLSAKYHTRDLNGQEIASFNSILREVQNSINIKRAGLGEDKLKILERKPSFKLVEEEGGESFIMYGAYFALVFYMYMMLVMYSNILVVEIATEKGSKMIEFIFSSVKAGVYFAGKIFGNFLAVITQTAIYLILALLAYFGAKRYGLFEKFNIDLGSLLGDINVLMLVELASLVILSLLIYMILAAMLGSLAKKQEDAGKVGTPLILVIIFAFVIALSFMGKEETLLIKVLSYLPFVSVFFMPMRLIRSSVGLGYGLISILIMLVSIILAYKIASKVYKKNILNYSSNSWIKKILRKA